MNKIWNLTFKTRGILGLSSLAFIQITLFHLNFIQIEYKFNSIKIGAFQEQCIFVLGMTEKELKNYYDL